jgi:hypothetical protein
MTPYILSNGHKGDANAKILDLHEMNEQLERELDFSEKTGRQIWQANERLKAELEQERALADRLASALTDSATWSHALPAYQAWKEARDESHETRPVL